MLEFHFNKVAGLKTSNFNKKRLQHRCFSVKSANTLFCRTHPVAASGNFSRTLSLLLMRMMNGVISRYILALQSLFHIVACVSFLSISLFFYLFVDSTTC